jgi:germination protein M
VRRAALLAVLAALAGCGDGDTSATTVSRETTTTPGPTQTSSVLVYFLREGKVAAARRTVEHRGDVAAAAIRALVEGPTAEEASAGLATAVVPETRVGSLSIVNGSARIELIQPEIEEEDVVTTASVAQVVYTLTQFPSVRGVVYEGTRVLGAGLTRKDMEEWTPAILVESPVLGETVSSPIRVTGTANTFEATLMLRVEAGGRKVAERFATATSGSGQRGTFDATIAVPPRVSGRIVLVAFESSAVNGEPINVVRIPLRLQ